MTEVYIRPQPHDGRLLGWEHSLANYAMAEVVKAGTQHSLVTLHSLTRKPCLLFSTGGRATALVVAFYDVTSNVSLEVIARDRYDLLIDDWQDHCTAFVVAEFFVEPNPRFVCLSSAATTRAADELAANWCSEFPALEGIDKAIGSSLVLSSKRAARTSVMESSGTPAK